jgi:hypothetical protein
MHPERQGFTPVNLLTSCSSKEIFRRSISDLVLFSLLSTSSEFASVPQTLVKHQPQLVPDAHLKYLLNKWKNMPRQIVSGTWRSRNAPSSPDKAL